MPDDIDELMEKFSDPTEPPLRDSEIKRVFDEVERLREEAELGTYQKIADENNWNVHKPNERFRGEKLFNYVVVNPKTNEELARAETRLEALSKALDKKVKSREKNYR